MTREEIFKDFEKKIKSGEYRIAEVCRSNSDGKQQFDFKLVPQSSPRLLTKKLTEEHLELTKKIVRLSGFMESEHCKNLGTKEILLMRMQYNAMQVYADTLLQRIDEIKERM